ARSVHGGPARGLGGAGHGRRRHRLPGRGDRPPHPPNGRVACAGGIVAPRLRRERRRVERPPVATRRRRGPRRPVPPPTPALCRGWVRGRGRGVVPHLPRCGMLSAEIIHADCLDILATMEAGSVCSVVTDPPAGIAFMGREWDRDKGGRDAWVAWMRGIAEECLRVAKPGAHALVWALPRTSHWTATAWEDAGWDVRDRVAHLHGQGFPKSLNLDGEWEGWGTALKPAMED